MDNSTDHPLEITTDDLVRMRANPDLLLLDCRRPDEHAIAQIEGSLLIPMQEIAERLAEIEDWRQKPLVVHCHHGMRSLRVVEFLREKGFSTAQSLTGGIDAWSLEVDADVPRY
ncbi:rhodanese [bacterium]|jgi:rhodanese-related sulfurtransferase|nr:rhodanese [Pirellulales bacterium]NBP79255.1 rhodanese [bacterium]